MSVTLTPKEMESPLKKYFDLDIDPCPPEIFKQVMDGEFEGKSPLHPNDLNRLFDDGYLDAEFGVYTLEDGGITVANLTKMPGVTPEMFDWWFAWHGLSTMRYKIWDKDDHYYAQTRNTDIALNDQLSLKERYWNTTHDVKEALLDGESPTDIVLNFVNPVEVGFDKNKLNSFKGTIVCTPAPALMVHFVRPTTDGCELRTRFFFGYTYEYGQYSKLPYFEAPEMFAKALLIHNVKEFTHLAKILPALYAEYKDDFYVGL
ncbi:MAG: phloretin hydrolase [Eubacterium sp.]|nr:phloretin hydrolase [Eubacterium sp.]